MELVGHPLCGSMLQNVHAQCIDECSEVKAAIAYAQPSTKEILLIEDSVRTGKKVTFYGRMDGSCPVDLRILRWFLDRKTPNAVCRLVPYWLHAKVIWWVGAGAYIGSANLTDRAWFKNYEAGLFVPDVELEHLGLTLQLDSFFEAIDAKSKPLTEEEYRDQEGHAKRRSKLLADLRSMDRDFEDKHRYLKDRTSEIGVDGKATRDRRISEFAKEWSETLQQLRDIGTRVARPENRPDWIEGDVPAGVQADQFLHAYYYQIVRTNREKDAYEEFFNRHRADPEGALASAIRWWRSGDYEYAQEKDMMENSARELRGYFARERLASLTEADWVDALTRVHAFGDHGRKLRKAFLGVPDSASGREMSMAFAKWLRAQRTVSGEHSALEVMDYVIWGQGDIAERIWKATHTREWKLPHVGVSILGELVGWARPDDFPPRNARTSKALRSLGYPVAVGL